MTDATDLSLRDRTFEVTDEMLTWQTECFTELATSSTDGSSYVVELPRYSDDKGADEADTIDAVRSLQ